MLTTTIKTLAPRGSTDETAYVPIASVTVHDDGAVTLRGDLRTIPLEQPLNDPKTRERVLIGNDPERWARLLPTVLRGSGMKVTVEEESTGPFDVNSSPSPVAAVRRLMGLTTRQAAAEVGVSQAALTQAEKRGANVSFDLVDRYSKSWGVQCVLVMGSHNARGMWRTHSQSTESQDGWRTSLVDLFESWGNPPSTISCVVQGSASQKCEGADFKTIRTGLEGLSLQPTRSNVESDLQ